MKTKNKKSKVTNMKYTQKDRDKQQIAILNEMEKAVIGDHGIGQIKHLESKPGKIQKALEQKEKDFELLLKNNKDYIFWEARKRSADNVQNWMKAKSGEVTEDEIIFQMKESLKKYELEVVEELVEEHF